MSSLASVYLAGSVAGAAFFGETVRRAIFAALIAHSCTRRVRCSGVHGTLLAVRCFRPFSSLTHRLTPLPQLPEREDSHDRRNDGVDSHHVWHLGHLHFPAHIPRLRWTASSRQIS